MAKSCFVMYNLAVLGVARGCSPRTCPEGPRDRFSRDWLTSHEWILMMTKILAATGNRGKLREFKEILEPLGFEIIGPDDVGGIPDVVEDRDTFEGNAVKKAVEVAAAKKCLVLADDSGLEVDALGGAPGVYSARYSGEDSNDARNVQKLLAELPADADRGAHFTCVLAIADATGVLGTARGEVTGRIIDAPRGSNGFGYDPVFVPDGHEQTFAELASEVKNGMSHRANALQAAIDAKLFDQLLTDRN